MNKPLLCLLAVFLSSCNMPCGADSDDLLPENTFAVPGIEGPATAVDGTIYAVNYQRKGTIGFVKIDGDKGVTHGLFVELPQGSTGNGIRFDNDGYMYVADYTAHNILKINMATKEVSIFAHSNDMNQPNDIAIDPVTQNLYASDPCWADSTGKVWLINRAGEAILLEEGMGTTNGIEVSPDGKKLYVNESVQRNIWLYDINNEGGVENKRLFYSFPDFGMDGMRCDPNNGNLYVTRHGKGTVVVLSPNGEVVKEYKLKGKLPSNITQGKDKRWYVTMADRGCFEIISHE